jgi:hypothetical protein
MDEHELQEEGKRRVQAVVSFCENPTVDPLGVSSPTTTFLPSQL